MFGIIARKPWLLVVLAFVLLTLFWIYVVRIANSVTGYRPLPEPTQELAPQHAH